MKFPVKGQWKVDHSTDKGLNLYGTRNILFDRQGYATLANRTVKLFDEANDADFRIPISNYYNGSIEKIFTTNDGPYSVSLENPVSITQDGLANQPSGSFDSSGVKFNGTWVVSESADLHSFNGSAWTDLTVTLASGVRHPLCVFESSQTLLVGNGNQVKQFNTSYTETTNLSLPGGLEVTGIAYNRNFVAIIAATDDQFSHLFIWDGATAAANYAYPLGSNRAFFIVAYRDTFVTLNGVGQLLYWDSSGLKQLDAFPSFYTTAILGDSDKDNRSVAHDTSAIVNGDLIMMNVALMNDSRNSEKNAYNPLQPSGIWTYDSNFGLYHRYGISGAKLLTKNFTDTAVNLGTDVITVSATVPDTGTPFLLDLVTGSGVTPLTPMQTYYVIKLTSTTFKLAASYTDALAGTAINLTAVGTGDYTGQFLPISDFGQSEYGNNFAGVLSLTGPVQTTNPGDIPNGIYSEYAYGSENVSTHFAESDETDSFGVVSAYGENRGYFITQKLFSSQIEDTWQKLYIKAREIQSDIDMVVAKYRSTEDVNMPLICTEVATAATWTSSNTFTTTYDLSTAQVGYEIEFIKGAASGYTAHITALSLNAGTWTVTVDETIKNISVSDTSYFVVDNWLKLSPIINSTSDKNYTEFSIGQSSKWVQFKVELRGMGVAIEEMELINSTHQASS